MGEFSSAVDACPGRLRSFVFDHLHMRRRECADPLWQTILEVHRRDLSDREATILLREIWKDQCQPSRDSFEKFYNEVHLPSRKGEVCALRLPAPRTYLDVGCGDGAITSLLRAHYGLSAESCWAVDFLPQPQRDGISFLKLEQTQPYRLPFETESFSTVTAFNTLHHSTSVADCLAEITRVLEPNGFFVLREHDGYSEDLRSFLMFVDLFFYEVIYESLVPGGRPHYHSTEQWWGMLDELGFKLIRVLRPARCRIYETVDLVLQKGY